MDEIASLTLGKALFALERTPKYLRWRYGSHPDTPYYAIQSCVRGRPRAVALFKLYPPGKPNRINFVEWLSASDDHEGTEVLKMLEEYAASQGLPVMIWHNVHDYPRYHILERRGYCPGEPIFYFGVFALGVPASMGQYNDWRNWYIAMGDVDVF